MSALDQLNVFKYHNPITVFLKDDGWQFAPMCMIFDIKHNLRHKARFVGGGHVVDSSNHTTYSSTVQDLLWLVMTLDQERDV
eukprot:1123821-Ditylum_brightwellii.AAC.1